MAWLEEKRNKLRKRHYFRRWIRDGKVMEISRVEAIDLLGNREGKHGVNGSKEQRLERSNRSEPLLTRGEKSWVWKEQ